MERERRGDAREKKKVTIDLRRRGQEKRERNVAQEKHQKSPWDKRWKGKKESLKNATRRKKGGGPPNGGEPWEKMGFVFQPKKKNENFQERDMPKLSSKQAPFQGLKNWGKRKAGKKKRLTKGLGQGKKFKEKRGDELHRQDRVQKETNGQNCKKRKGHGAGRVGP